ncbi:unnamed protein product [Cyclocybe aegerita]|uniref:Uncharacterized protein n=1 Tax=Cyclocybe aegerita TaxID=1973307 RepID=A0A8S0WP91_CYCAE|nr:unnamed protein product [Cyclocybe aegerita]
MGGSCEAGFKICSCAWFDIANIANLHHSPKLGIYVVDEGGVKCVLTLPLHSVRGARFQSHSHWKIAGGPPVIKSSIGTAVLHRATASRGSRWPTYWLVRYIYAFN